MKLKKIFFLLFFYPFFTFSEVNQELLKINNTGISWADQGIEDVTIIENVAIGTAKKYFFGTGTNGILAFTVIIMFFIIATKLFIAEGNTEEWTSGRKAFSSIIVGLAIISIAYAFIKIITTLNV